MYPKHSFLDQFFVYEGSVTDGNKEYEIYLLFSREEHFDEDIHCDCIRLMNISINVLRSGGECLRDVCLLSDGYWKENVSYGIKTRLSEGAEKVLLCGSLVGLKFIQGFIWEGFPISQVNFIEAGKGLIYGRIFEFGLLSESIPENADEFVEGIDRREINFKIYPFNKCEIYSSLVLEVALIVGIKGAFFIKSLSMYYEGLIHKKVLQWDVGCGECRLFGALLHNVSVDGDTGHSRIAQYESWKGDPSVITLNDMFIPCVRQFGPCIIKSPKLERLFKSVDKHLSGAMEIISHGESAVVMCSSQVRYNCDCYR